MSKGKRQDAYDSASAVQVGTANAGKTINTGLEFTDNAVPGETFLLRNLVPEYAIEISEHGKQIYTLKLDGTEWRSDSFTEERGLAIALSSLCLRAEEAGVRAVEALKAHDISPVDIFRALGIAMVAVCQEPPKEGEE